MIVFMVVLMAIAATLLYLLLFARYQQRRDRRQLHRSLLELELDAMRASARIRGMTSAANDYMDTFIQQREAEQRQVVNGTVNWMHDDIQGRWP